MLPPPPPGTVFKMNTEAASAVWDIHDVVQHAHSLASESVNVKFLFIDSYA